jgi:D-alanyl-lipoteichoic acid acyltransferase DltB (MBOAT superfamily)
LGISFFTFTQIAYLVDAYCGITKEYNLLDYCLFVVFFPHLIAGPIIHHKDVIPQFSQPRIFRLDPENLAVGLTVFVFGLFKKTVLADGIAKWSSPVFDLAKNGADLGFYQAWGGALAYTLQIYFDFSGYSDMAIGLSKMFGVRFPVNFNSPYQAVNIIEFWRRWHMTLSRFLRDYLYFSLGGNRRGPARRYVNLFATMLLGGLWHGAGWTFVIWGGLHGVYLMVNHGWHALWKRLGHDSNRATLPGIITARIVTFLAVVLAWVFFRAETVTAATTILKAMARVSEIIPGGAAEIKGVTRQLLWTVGMLAIVWVAPNTQHILARSKPAWDSPASPPDVRCWEWRPNRCWAVVLSALFLVAVMHLCKITEFLYFQF